MRWISVFPILVLAAVGVALGQTTSERSGQAVNAADQSAIRLIITHWQQAWDTFNASVLDGDYADDADWINAFGVKNKGSAKIMSFMVGVLQQPAVRGRHTVWKETQIRFIRPDVALVNRDYQTIGQKTNDGKDMPQRNTHCNWVLLKENGKWQVASQVISDDK